MMKFVFVLLIGLAAGYFYGFKDARRHDDNIVVRTVGKVGGSNRENFNNDLDAKTARVGR